LAIIAATVRAIAGGNAFRTAAFRLLTLLLGLRCVLLTLLLACRIVTLHFAALFLRLRGAIAVLLIAILLRALLLLCALRLGAVGTLALVPFTPNPLPFTPLLGSTFTRGFFTLGCLAIGLATLLLRALLLDLFLLGTFLLSTGGAFTLIPLAGCIFLASGTSPLFAFTGDVLAINATALLLCAWLLGPFLLPTFGPLALSAVGLIAVLTGSRRNGAAAHGRAFHAFARIKVLRLAPAAPRHVIGQTADGFRRRTRRTARRTGAARCRAAHIACGAATFVDACNKLRIAQDIGGPLAVRAAGAIAVAAAITVAITHSIPAMAASVEASVDNGVIHNRVVRDIARPADNVTIAIARRDVASEVPVADIPGIDENPVGRKAVVAITPTVPR
jgi:hypothetical protein